MKKLLLVLVIFIGLIGCSSGDSATDVVIDKPTNTITGEVVSFVNGAHPTSGKAFVETNSKDNSRKLKLSNFKTDKGPQLLIYLTSKIGSSDFVSLGAIKGVDGNYEYDIPKGTDLNKYFIVDVWCVDFKVSFGHAVFEK